MKRLGSPLASWPAEAAARNAVEVHSVLETLRSEEAVLMMGGGAAKIAIQHRKKRMTARERLEVLLDEGTPFLEVGLFAGWGMYDFYGSPPAAGLVAGIGRVSGRDCMILANDATVKAGAYFEVTLKKQLRGQQIALENRLPVIYLVDSAGVFLPLQDQVFPDEAHFGRIFYHNARLSSLGIPQIAAVMGPCVAGGAYLPVMCDKFIMVDGASMFLAGPALVRAAIGQEIDEETLGGAVTHNAISGTADYRVADDRTALELIRNLISHLPPSPTAPFSPRESREPAYPMADLDAIVPPDGGAYDMEEILARILDGSEWEPYKEDYGRTVLCGVGRIGGYSVGIVANQKRNVKSPMGKIQMGGVIYSDSADKAARFIMNCNQDRMPLLFLHDVNGFMVGREAEWGGIAKDGAKMVQAVANSVVPKITVVIGGSYGAGNYAMSGRAYNPRFLYFWPSARVGVMGGTQASETLAEIQLARGSGEATAQHRQKILEETRTLYERQSNPRYGAARLWADAIITPGETRRVIIRSLEICRNQPAMPSPSFGVLQV